MRGALALITGRDIDVVNRLLHRLVLPVAGVHGLRRRDAEGQLHSSVIDQGIVVAIAAEIESRFSDEPGVIIEKKTGAVALHCRLRPDLETRCLTLAQKIVRDLLELHLIINFDHRRTQCVDLIYAEAAMNALKHAFSSDVVGKIKLRLRRVG